MHPQTFEFLLEWILKEYEGKQSIFGIPRELFYRPQPDCRFAVPDMFGQYLATPIGPAAGPHTQLAQNIVSAWLSGARFIELKTVQIRDALEILRPCIDMEDEGYNVEWSQELRLEQSAREYINAWALIHVLHRLLGFEGEVPPGTIFNMSVGYDLEGIRSAPMSRFMDSMADASAELEEIRAVLGRRFPHFADIEIPCRITNNVTLSTMHGCPPEEIEHIARHLLNDRGLHTWIKLNPTLLGRDAVETILHEDLDFREILIPGAVFEHDLAFPRAVELIRSLQSVAADCRRAFGVKLSNTLATVNHRRRLPGGEAYMSGRALYPLALQLFWKLASEFAGNLRVSFSGGADALNVSTLLACGARPVTAASDILKPGGYSRLLQYMDNLDAAMRASGAGSLDDLACDPLRSLERAAAEARQDPRYQKRWNAGGLPKTSSGLDLFDCIAAPCVEPCAIRQDVPEYARLIALGEYDRALEVIMARNPLPGITGYVCTQLCQKCCTRTATNYDEPVAIRALKRFAAEHGKVTPAAGAAQAKKVAIIGSGPSGLSAAYFLVLNGVAATIFEAKNVAGGMMRMAPAFRLPSAIIRGDVERIRALGVTIHYSHPITRPPEELLRSGFDAVYIASGFQANTDLPLEGADGPGVVSALDLLDKARRREHVTLGRRVLVIGGGDTALDAARTAQRLTGHPVTVVYRRTRAEMPAGEEDRKDAFEEGIILEELASPVRVFRNGSRIVALQCLRNTLGAPGADGRRRPVPVKGSAFRLPADTIIIAAGQSPDLFFLEGSVVTRKADGSIAVNQDTGQAGADRIYAGGDVVAGPATIIEACADGRRAAEAMCREFGIRFTTLPFHPAPLTEADIVLFKSARARREIQHRPDRVPPDQRGGFQMIEATLTEEAARREAARCLQCSAFCDKCVEVCPNRANQAYQVAPQKIPVPVLTWRDIGLALSGQADFQIIQRRQILHLHDLCNECGNCATFCVRQGRPYEEKPRLFLNSADFEKETGNAFHFETRADGWTIRHRVRSRESQLALSNDTGELVFENECARVVLAHFDFSVQALTAKESFSGDVVLASLAEMYIVAQGALQVVPSATASFGSGLDDDVGKISDKGDQ